MQDIKPAHHITHTTLPDGTTVHINDHVYLAPEHLGEPYYIGRVMEFCTSSKRKGLQARIAWFNRPKDVINRKSADPCLLIATMHSDINSVFSIRGKCIVTHKYYVPKDKIDVYRKTPDHFYYNQLYDRYIQRVYDVVPCETVQNVPMDTLEALKQRYQFIVVEQGKAADLTVARRICCVCQEWCQSAVSVKCAGCQKSYHMSCLNPPLTRKPSKGFAWQCAFCTKQEADSNPQSPIAACSSSAVESPASRPTSKSPSSVKEMNEETANNSSTSNGGTSSSNRTRTRTTRSQLMRQASASASQKQLTPDSTKSLRLKLSKNIGSDDIIDHAMIGLKNQQIKMTHMWPFRYFGVNTNIKDILDIDDRIYPRAKSRIGTKYQANVPDFACEHQRSVSPASDSNASSVSSAVAAMAIKSSPDAQCSKSRNSNKLSDRKGKSVASPTSLSTVQKFHNNGSSKMSANTSPTLGSSSSIEMPDLLSTNRESYIPTRGGPDTVTCIYRPGILNDEQVDDYMDNVKELKNIPLPSYSADLMDRALYELELNSYHTDIAYEHMSHLDSSDFKHVVEWTPTEIENFEQSIREHGHDLNFAKNRVKTKSMADIVRYFYQWKKTERYETVYSEWTKIYRPLKKFKKFPRNKEIDTDLQEDEQDQDRDSEEDADPTIVPRATYAKKSYQCMNCFTHNSAIWRRSPSDFDRKRQVFNKVLCNECGIFWLKYAKTKPISSEIRIANMASSSMHEDNEKKRKRASETSGMKSMAKRIKDEKGHPHSRSHILRFDPSPCRICSLSSPDSRLYTCHGCGMSVHSDCYGIDTKKQEKVGWRCDPCDNKIHPVSSYIYECVLCFNSKHKHQPLKRTAGYNWAHVQCATFIPEVKFVNPKTLSPVEYIGCINPARLEVNCRLCENTRGACVACFECRKPVHVQCAIDHHFKLAFEIQPNTHNSNKSAQYPIVPAGLFGTTSPSGLMIPQVCCPSHNVSNRKLVDLKTRTTGNTQESSLMTYVKRYKSIGEGTTPAMRRFLAANHEMTKSLSTAKLPNPRDAVLQALAIDSNYVINHISAVAATASPPKSIKLSLHVGPISPKSRHKYVCSTPGCHVQHSPIWWNTDDKRSFSDHKICHRCHVLQKVLKK